MHYKYLLFGFIFSFVLSSILAAIEPIKITQVLDTNQFKTEDGKIISLANVSTFSIQDPDSFKQKFAFKVYKYAQKNLIDKELLNEFVSENDSIKKVHLWKKRLIFLSSVNESYLDYGFGYFDPEPKSEYSPNTKEQQIEPKINF